jgi:hypothetical protein
VNVSTCGLTATSTLTDSEGDPGRYYCPAWSGGLRLRIIRGVNGQILFKGSATHFWGAMEVPDSNLRLDGSHTTIWGAVVANIASSGAQFTWHFDDSLLAVSTSQYELKNWREEPIT